MQRCDWPRFGSGAVERATAPSFARPSLYFRERARLSRRATPLASTTMASMSCMAGTPLAARARASVAKTGKRASRGSLVIRASAETDAAAALVERGYPFVKIVGQDELKLALTLNVVDSKIGGCLIMGDRGTAKSVAVRALSDLLPDIEIVPGDPFNSSPTDPELMGPEVLEKFRAKEDIPTGAMKIPMVEVPLGTTEDRICGTIDIEKALAEGVKAYDPGLLARANRGLLYIDEVNLLDDSLVDVVLDSAAGGWNTVEREGISITHPAKFIMIGSGNPEEGELRPQLLDRFGMACNVRTIFDRELRVQLVKNRMEFEEDPEGFVKSCEEETNELKTKIAAAQKLLKEVKMERDLAIKISGVCALVDVDGLRGDIVVTRAAKALVAYERRTEVTEDDIKRVIGPCLSHRLRKDPMDTMDGSFKVMLGFNKIFKGSAMADFAGAMAEGIEDPEAKAKEEEKAKADPAPKKAGAWGGLPGGR